MYYKRYNNSRNNFNKCECKNVREERCEPVIRREYNCGVDKKVIKHQHIVRYQHDIVNEYDVVFEHEYNYYDVVTNREVVKRNDCTSYKPNYCEEDLDCREEMRDCCCEKKDCDC